MSCRVLSAALVFVLALAGAGRVDGRGQVSSADRAFGQGDDQAAVVGGLQRDPSLGRPPDGRAPRFSCRLAKLFLLPAFPALPGPSRATPGVLSAARAPDLGETSPSSRTSRGPPSSAALLS